ncbi:hypothetical protein EDB85DRAFT_2282555 [Lactarius pseudohatsudake]|nr:hypothetical protein EDB85DRAFT_2282555 [Lactarius pseudohatsudake]
MAIAHWCAPRLARPCVLRHYGGGSDDGHSSPGPRVPPTSTTPRGNRRLTRASPDPCAPPITAAAKTLTGLTTATKTATMKATDPAPSRRPSAFGQLCAISVFLLPHRTAGASSSIGRGRRWAMCAANNDNGEGNATSAPELSTCTLPRRRQRQQRHVRRRRQRQLSATPTTTTTTDGKFGAQSCCHGGARGAAKLMEDGDTTTTTTAAATAHDDATPSLIIHIRLRSAATPSASVKPPNPAIPAPRDAPSFDIAGEERLLQDIVDKALAQGVARAGTRRGASDHPACHLRNELSEFGGDTTTTVAATSTT